MKTFALFSHFASIILFLCLSCNTVEFAQATPSDFTLKLQNLIDKTGQIREVFQDIAVQLNNEGAPGFERVVEFGERMRVRLDSIRNKINNLTNLFSLESLSIPFNNIHVNKQNLWGHDWNFTIPELKLRVNSSNDSPNISPVPKFKTFLLNFIDMLDQPLDNLLQHAQDLRDSITTNLALAKSHQKYGISLEPGSFPEAEYWYPDIIRHTLGRPGVVLTLKELHPIFEAIKDIIEAYTGQEIEILGEGGNLRVISSIKAVFDIVEIFKECAEHVEGLETFDLDTGSYTRLEYIHEEVDTLRRDFRDWVTLSIRTRIEINLAGHGDHPHPIAIFQLPAQFGGYLELARDIVQETINTMLAAGEDVFQAQLFLGHGDDEFLASHYKKAYQWYSKSYNEATK